MTAPHETEIRRVQTRNWPRSGPRTPSAPWPTTRPTWSSSTCPPPLRHAGLDATGTSGWDAWFDTWDGPIRQEISECSATIAEADGIAFCHGLARMRGLKVGDGATELVP
jgi:hypothetical protein